jgi:ElaB/YqjD/DUF883 family membrane-anchored ribosome-binding protein
MPFENNNNENEFETQIFSNQENWNTHVGKLVTKFEQMISNIEEIKDEYTSTLSKDELIELKNKSSRYLTYLENFINDEYPRGSIREITENINLEKDYSYNAAENLRTELQNLISQMETKISQQNAGKRRKTYRKKSRKNKKTNKTHKKGRHTRKYKR